MSSDKALADRVVALLPGHLLKYGDEKGGPYLIYLHDYADAKMVVHDWRVAGKCLELMSDAGYCVSINPETPHWVVVHTGENSHEVENESLPRAIIEACCEALE